MEQQEIDNRAKYPMFFKLWDLQQAKMKSLSDRTYKSENRPPIWDDFEIYATTKKDFDMDVGHSIPYCDKGTRVRIWMVSRFGDCGITENLVNPIGYDIRVDPDDDLTDYEFVKKK